MRLVYGRAEIKHRSCDWLRFLLGARIGYPPFAKTRLRLRQFAQWRKLARALATKASQRSLRTCVFTPALLLPLFNITNAEYCFEMA